MRMRRSGDHGAIGIVDGDAVYVENGAAGAQGGVNAAFTRVPRGDDLGHRRNTVLCKGF